MEKIEIKNRYDGHVIFRYECVDNNIAITVCEAVKRGADLRGAYLGGADLHGAFLRDADLHGADLGGADLRSAKDVPYIPLACPSHGSFIGWKKVCGHLVELEIPADARRSSATSTKCRCDKAKVLSIVSREGIKIKSIHSETNAPVDYVVGQVVTPDSFDEDRWKECSHGIHFFINKEEAERY